MILAGDETALRLHGRETIRKGSKSFALASAFFNEAMRSDAQMLYAWCRYCDDIIDGQTLGGDAPDGNLSIDERRRRVDLLRSRTLQALAGENIGEPAFDGFARVAARHNLPARFALDLIDGFAIDIEPRVFETADDLMPYCYGVAGVVGVMMALIMGVRREDSDTLMRACDMGMAFQITNICRDVIDDAQGGRIYLPRAYLTAAGVEADVGSVLSPDRREAVWRAACRLLDDAERYYISASAGIAFLPPRAASAIAAARNVYRSIGRRLRTEGASCWTERIVVPPARKMSLALSGAIGGLAASLVRPRTLPARDTLWSPALG